MQNKIYVHILPYFPASPMQYVQYISNKWYQSRHHYWYQNRKSRLIKKQTAVIIKNEQKYSLDYSIEMVITIRSYPVPISTNIPAGSLNAASTMDNKAIIQPQSALLSC